MKRHSSFAVLLLFACDSRLPSSEADPCIGMDYPIFGMDSLGALGDADGDGTADLLLADLGYSHPQCTPLLWLISGAQRRALYRVELPPWDAGRCPWTRRLGDLDGDGVSEWALSDGNDEAAPKQRVFDGRTGKLLREAIVPGLEAASRFVVVLGDFDRDGAPDALVRASPLLEERRFTVHSLRDGKLLSTMELRAAMPVRVDCALGLEGSGIILLAGTTAQDRRPALLALDWKSGALGFEIDVGERATDRLAGLHAVPDLDDDAAPDFAVAIGNQVELHSSSDGRRLAVLQGLPGDDFGRKLLAIRSPEGDLQFAVSAEDAGIAQGRVDFFDRNGGKLRSIEQKYAWHFGATLVDAGDQDGDGCSELLISGDHSQSHSAGKAWVFSLASGKCCWSFTRWGKSIWRLPRWLS